MSVTVAQVRKWLEGLPADFIVVIDGRNIREAWPMNDERTFRIETERAA